MLRAHITGKLGQEQKKLFSLRTINLLFLPRQNLEVIFSCPVFKLSEMFFISNFNFHQVATIFYSKVKKFLDKDNFILKQK